MNSFMQFAPFLIWAVVLAVPLVVLVQRLGKSVWWNAHNLVPFPGAVVLLDILPFNNSPRLDHEGASV